MRISDYDFGRAEDRGFSRRVKILCVRYHELFAIEFAIRRITIMGIVLEPDRVWVEQIARNATDAFSGSFFGKK